MHAPGAQAASRARARAGRGPKVSDPPGRGPGRGPGQGRARPKVSDPSGPGPGEGRVEAPGGGRARVRPVGARARSRAGQVLEVSNPPGRGPGPAGAGPAPAPRAPWRTRRGPPGPKKNIFHRSGRKAPLHTHVRSRPQNFKAKGRRPHAQVSKVSDSAGQRLDQPLRTKRGPPGHKKHFFAKATPRHAQPHPFETPPSISLETSEKVLEHAQNPEFRNRV